MGKQKKDAGKLESAADAQNAPADAADDAAVASATGSAAEAGAGDAAGGDEKPADATDAGEVQGAADAGADAADAEGDQPGESEGVTDEEDKSTADPPASASDQNNDSGGVTGGTDGPDAADGRTDDGGTSAAGDASAETVAAEGPMTIAQLAREVSGLAELFTSREPIDIECFARDQVFGAEESEIMAEFVIEHPDAPLLAMYKHLEIRKRLPATTPNNADIMALSMFRFACLAAVEFLRCDAAEQGPAKVSELRPHERDELAMQPADPNPLTELGRRLQG